MPHCQSGLSSFISDNFEHSFNYSLGFTMHQQNVLQQTVKVMKFMEQETVAKQRSGRALRLR